MPINLTDKRAPMASAPLKYLSDGSVDWSNMWNTFCMLALDGGPPHRGTMLYAREDADPNSAGYQFAANEIIRGIRAVSGLTASVAAPGWIVVQCTSVGMARWLAEAIIQENVQTRHEGVWLLLPVGDTFTLKGEIKNVITAVAKTTHYWREHLPLETKHTLTLQVHLESLKRRVQSWFKRRRALPANQ